jgi:hypothetical protein
MNEAIKLSRTDDSKQALDAFMEHLYRETQEHPFECKARILGGVVLIEAKPFCGAIHISAIYALKMRERHGTRALSFLCNLADTYRVMLRLAPIRIGRDGMTSAKLRKWYQGYGFIKADGTTMVRLPNVI